MQAIERKRQSTSPPMAIYIFLMCRALIYSARRWLCNLALCNFR